MALELKLQVGFPTMRHAFSIVISGMAWGFEGASLKDYPGECNVYPCLYIKSNVHREKMSNAHSKAAR